MSEAYDAVVIGGGPGGGSAALALARAGWSVLLCERKAFPRRKVCGEYLSATNLPLLDHLGLGGVFRERAGPEVSRVGLFAGAAVLEAPLPRPAGGGGWGRALGRETLDGLLLDQARAAGARVVQPGAVVSLARHAGRWHGRFEGPGGVGAFDTAVVVAAHGSWDSGPLPTQCPRGAPRPGDLLGFKAHFRDSALPAGLMPLLAFPGGYGGMVHTDAGRVSISLCIRRDRLERVRGGSAAAAGEVVGGYVGESCEGVRRALAGARLEGPWLATGPLRPGTRLRQPPGVFPVGNVAGEAHPAIAEGISMALQSGWLLAGELERWRREGGRGADLPAAAARYARLWRRNFGPRLLAAAWLARWATRPAAVRLTLPVLRLAPAILTWGARASGKSWALGALGPAGGRRSAAALV